MSLTRLKVVRDSVEQSSDKQPGCCCKCVKNVCKKCEQTVDCWLKEADKRERKQMQKELAGSKNLLTHTHNTLTYTDSNTALCNEEMLANPLCVIVEVLNKAICNEEMLANPLCVIVEVLNNATCNEEMLATLMCDC